MIEPTNDQPSVDATPAAPAPVGDVAPAAPASPEAAPPVETAPVGGQPVAPATEAPAAAAPAQPAVEPDDEPIHIPGLPGQRQQVNSEGYTPQEVAALQQYVQQAQMQMQQYQQQLRQYELAGLSEEEQRAALVEQQQQTLAQREAALQDWYARNQWYQYYQQWVPEGTVKGDDPVQWQHSVLANLYEQKESLSRQNRKLQQEVEALRKVATPSNNPAPHVTTQSGAPVVKKSLWDMKWDEMEAFKDAALLGNVAPTDYPAI